MPSSPSRRSRLESFLDFLRLVDEKGREDGIFILASGVAFNLLLAAIPLMVVTIVAGAFVLERSGEQTIAHLTQLLGRLVPVPPEGEAALRERVAVILSAAPTAVSLGTVAFVWFSTRLFGSLRGVLSSVFDITDRRSPIRGKLFDMLMAVVAAVILAIYFALTAYIAIATTQGIEFLAHLGIRREVMGNLEYNIGRFVAFLFIFITFYLVYRYLPYRRCKVRLAVVGALFASVMFEVARVIFMKLAPNLNPGSIYSGIVAVSVVAVVWAYYVAVLFVLGGEVAQVHNLMRVRRLQRVVFE